MYTHPHTQTAVLGIVLVSYLIIVLDISIVITGLPHIQQELHFRAADLSWVQSAYTLTFGGLLLLGARAGDILGRRRLFLIGLAVFTSASLAIGLAPSAQWLILARAIQGIGSAILAPATLALLTTHFAEGPARTRALGYYGATAGVAASLGLVLGGLLADSISWRVGFFINLPIGIGLWLAAHRWIKETERHIGELDIAGAITSTLGVGALVYGLVQAAEQGWLNPITQSSLLCGVGLLSLLIIIEHRAKQPIMPLHLFAHPIRAAAYAARVLFLGGMIGFWFFTTQLLQHQLGFNAFQAGLAFLPATLINFMVAIQVPHFSQRFGNAKVLIMGLLIATLGMFWLSCIHGPSLNYHFQIALPMLLIGAGQGLTLSPLTIAGVTGVQKHEAGAASGIVNVAHQLGSCMGLSLLVVIYAHTGNTSDGGQVDIEKIAATFKASSLLLISAAILIIWAYQQPSKNSSS